MRTSIFERLEQHYSNPIDEYLKISSFVGTKDCCYSHTFNSVFSELFQYCKALRKYYADYEECISDNVGFLSRYMYPIGNNTYIGFDENTKDTILDSFLTYIEIVVCMLCVFKKYASSIYRSAGINSYAINQLEEMIEESLRSINHKIESQSIEMVRIIKNDPVSELVAERSSPEMKDAILNYLSIRGNDTVNKEKELHTIIDLLEPTFKKYENVSIVKSAKEYAQLVRHPEIKKNDEEYKWFFADKEKHLDELFSLCIFAQQYATNKAIADSFDALKKKATNTTAK